MSSKEKIYKKLNEEHENDTNDKKSELNIIKIEKITEEDTNINKANNSVILNKEEENTPLFIKEIKKNDINKTYCVIDSSTKSLENKQLPEITTKEKKKIKIKAILENIIVILSSIILAIFIINYVAFIGKIPTTSMYPTIEIGDRILILRTYFEQQLNYGDVVVFEKEIDGKEIYLIKRLIAKGGDTVEIIEDGTVYVNGNISNCRFAIKANQEKQSFEVPYDHYFFLGDNRKDSYDSRYWDYSYISADDIIGKAIIRLSPLTKISMIENK